MLKLFTHTFVILVELIVPSQNLRNNQEGSQVCQNLLNFQPEILNIAKITKYIVKMAQTSNMVFTLNVKFVFLGQLRM